ncbi:ABC transporter ATP-binding protein [Engelhardtia mirabilis]|uniref:Lipid A export ATP-binding/permease protein MsbA n=1 Tax=Engelhardtia mirabilis TaxID=2528011 RepID=A0A518BHL5_9BACT|nr:Lipid A export ATP-binding/permease protein MsbA [Planctomycetes bacterium Pla133]QDV00797.1 Lipid A export ATP-binding/permease protein MsbA [Planctomycetes bacterium Pla86]
MKHDVLVTWDVRRAGEALAALARVGGLECDGVERAAGGGAAPAERRELDVFLRREGARQALDVESLECTWREVADAARFAAPCLVELPDGEGGLRLLALLGGRGRHLRVVEPSGRVRRVSTRAVVDAVRAGLDAVHGPRVEARLANAGLRGHRLRRAREEWLAQSLGAVPLFFGWVLRPRPGSPFLRQLRSSGALADLARSVATHGLAHVTFVAAWIALGRGALTGHFEPGWVLLWLLLLATLPLLGALESLWDGLFGLRAGTLLKRRLLHGVLAMEPDELRAEGAGRGLGRVLESEAVEHLAVASVTGVLLAAIELPVAFWALAAGPTGGRGAALLALWVVGSVAASAWVLRAQVRWTRGRLAATEDLIERIGGHRTRVAQQTSDRLHAGEDELLDRYLAAGAKLDRRVVLGNQLLSATWLIVGLAVLGSHLAAAGVGATAVAGGLGGLLLGVRALARVGATGGQVAGLVAAWDLVGPLFNAAAEPEAAGDPAAVPHPQRRDGGEPAECAPRTLLSVRGLGFGWPGRTRALFEDVDLELRQGDRVLLEGASGAGKSTLVGVLLGLRRPTSGVVLRPEGDRATVGAEGWRRGLSAAPQFHENHMFAASLAFNLLMGRRWPASDEDLREAEEVCTELGLGPLIESMPGGLQSQVGEGGWRLSHGERSRVFLARALLQQSDVVVLDESLGAMDPENQELAVACAARRAPALLVVAHP